MANNLKFFGIPFGKEPKPGANLIWSFHFGILKNSVYKKNKATGRREKVEQHGWDSERPNNFAELIKLVNDKKDAEKTLLIAMPSYGNYIVNFNLHDNLRAERLGIAIYDGDNFLGTITFIDIKVNKKTPHSQGASGYFLHDIHLGGTVFVAPK